ncbi:unnamed protein product [Psylliodes chrysocephalus]|uniref:Uncharacterized protein n=1 Tax=Psylliodes chrysocephalus TaxID=3402493 RepID=A0A9P0D937_9CUCU|nr:unnamed protein product [Psylliodes chrysocephala]
MFGCCGKPFRDDSPASGGDRNRRNSRRPRKSGGDYASICRFDSDDGSANDENSQIGKLSPYYRGCRKRRKRRAKRIFLQSLPAGRQVCKY